MNGSIFKLLTFTALFFLLNNVDAQTHDLNIVCGDKWEVQEKSFSDFRDPVIGFTTVDFSGSGLHWYVAEKDIAYLMGFKEFFAHNSNLGERTYVSGYEIGKVFIVPESEWSQTIFLNWPNTQAAFRELSLFAPRCKLQGSGLQIAQQ